jgi:mono/diheme cytochrome c family protein
VAYAQHDMPRLPAEGAVPAINPQGDIPAPDTQADLESVAGTLVNPLQPTAEVLARGALVYERHCWACHGPQGNGQGPVVGVGRFPFAPAIGSGAVARSEGYLYAITDVGRGLMPAYGARIPHLDRWAVAMYVRQLQAGGAVPGVAGAPSTLVAPGTAPTQAPTPAVLPMPVDSPAPATVPADSPQLAPPPAPGSR